MVMVNDGRDDGVGSVDCNGCGDGEWRWLLYLPWMVMVNDDIVYIVDDGDRCDSEWRR